MLPGNSPCQAQKALQYLGFRKQKICTFVYFLQLSLLINTCLCLTSALSEEEKSTLRAGLIANFNEPVNQVSNDIER